MGEARRRRLKSAELNGFSKELSRARFDLYTLGTRSSLARLMAEELSWWSDQDENLIGLIFKDLTDQDYGWNLLARDGEGRFRWIKGETDYSTVARALETLRETIAKDCSERGHRRTWQAG